MNESQAKYLNTSEVVQRTGVSLRKLQWWDEHDVISPRQMGHRRLYSPQDTSLILLVIALRRKNVSLQKIRRALTPLRRQADSAATALASALDGKNYLLLDSSLCRLHFESDPVRVCEMLDRSPRSMLLVRIPEESSGTGRKAHREP